MCWAAKVIRNEDGKWYCLDEIEIQSKVWAFNKSLPLLFYHPNERRDWETLHHVSMHKQKMKMGLIIFGGPKGSWDRKVFFFFLVIVTMVISWIIIKDMTTLKKIANIGKLSLINLYHY